MDCIIYGVAKSRTQLSIFHFLFHCCVTDGKWTGFECPWLMGSKNHKGALISLRHWLVAGPGAPTEFSDSRYPNDELQNAPSHPISWDISHDLEKSHPVWEIRHFQEQKKKKRPVFHCCCFSVYRELGRKILSVTKHHKKLTVLMHCTSLMLVE